MARSTCAKCSGTTFELVENEPVGGKFKYFFVQCNKCGAVIGVQEFFNAGSLLHKQGAAIKKIAAALNVSVDL